MRHTTIIQLGGRNLDISELLDDSFKYIYVPLDSPEDVVAAENMLVSDGNIADKYRDDIFILGVNSYVFLMKNVLTILPSNKIVYSKLEVLEEEDRVLLENKRAIVVDFSNTIQFSDFINENLFGGQYGLRLDPKHISIIPEFKKNLIQYGSRSMVLSHLDLLKLTQVINWRMTLQLQNNVNFEFHPDYRLIGEGTIVFQLVIMSVSGDILKKYYVHEKDLEDEFIFKSPNFESILYVSAYLIGDIKEITIRNIHIRKSRKKLGNFMLGSTMITDTDNYKEQFAVNFNPGNLKPPLNVYFSGFRTAEGFEGAGIMGTVGGGNTPYLLIADERLEGGAFYIGEDSFEEKLVNTIRKYLKKLKFSNKDLILSGISMGTTAALYYAADLQPAAVIVGKPLVNLGTIAANERLNRPHGFPTSLDLLLLHEGATDTKAQTRMNEYFWNHFKACYLEKTNFYIAYMKQDDYDVKAFTDLFKYLKRYQAGAHLIYKGLTGRHNDDTEGIVNWFMFQYNNVMNNMFNRGDTF